MTKRETEKKTEKNSNKTEANGDQETKQTVSSKKIRLQSGIDS